MTDEQLELAIERAIIKAFHDIGFDSSDVFETRRDLIFLREWRQQCDAVRSKGTLALVTLFITGAAALLVLGFRGWLFNG